MRLNAFFLQKTSLHFVKKTANDFVSEAQGQATTYAPEDAMKLVGTPGVRFVDVRDEFEVLAEGHVPGAVHASRGLLEFFIDPRNPRHKPVFASGDRLIFYCDIGERSALAAQRAREMGLDRVAHVAGGFRRWKQKGGPVEGPPGP